jgi:hypothetical protein
LSDTFSTQDVLKQGDALPLLLFNFGLEYAIRKTKGNQAGLELNGTHQFLVNADQLIYCGNVNAKKKHRNSIRSCNKTTTEVHPEKSVSIYDDSELLGFWTSSIDRYSKN